MLVTLTVHSESLFSFLSTIEFGVHPWIIDSPLANMYLATCKQVFKPGSKIEAIRQLQKREHHRISKNK